MCLVASHNYTCTVRCVCFQAVWHFTGLAMQAANQLLRYACIRSNKGNYEKAQQALSQGADPNWADAWVSGLADAFADSLADTQ